MTPMRVRELNAKKRFDRLRLRESRYASGAELVAAAGEVKLRAIAREHLAGRFERTEELSDRHLHVLEWVTFATYVWGRDGVIAPHDQLGALIGLKARRTGTIVRELVAWGYLIALPVFRPFRCVTSRRANAYQISPDLRAQIERRHAQPGNASSSSGVPGNPETPGSVSEVGRKAPPDTAWQCPVEVSAAAPRTQNFCTSAVPCASSRTNRPLGETSLRGTVGGSGGVTTTTGEERPPSLRDVLLASIRDVAETTTSRELAELLAHLTKGGAS